jgi:hypothetical protein
MSLKTWENEYSSIELHQGVVLTVRENRRALIEHDPKIQRLVQQVLAPGVYLVGPENIDSLRSALGAAGVEMVPRLAPAGTQPEFSDEFPEALSQPSLFDAGPGVDPRQHHGHETKNGRGTKGRIASGGAGDTSHRDAFDGADLIEELRNGLQRIDASDDKREEIAVRIDRKLILVPEQMDPSIVRAEKAEARGLDYVGKVRLIEQSLRAGGFFLEVIARGSNGEPKRTVLKPKTLERRGNNLWLNGTGIPGDLPVEINVSKMSLVRRLRGTLLSR